MLISKRVIFTLISAITLYIGNVLTPPPPAYAPVVLDEFYSLTSVPATDEVIIVYILRYAEIRPMYSNRHSFYMEN